MKKIIYTTIALSILLSVASCRKYVEIKPEQKRILKNTSDYQQLLYNSSLFDLSYFLPVYSGDDAGNESLVWQNSLNLTAANAYSWADRNYGATEEDGEWARFYTQLFICNTIINEVNDSEGGTPAQKSLALSSALVHRAYIYYTMVNIYAKQYDPVTAATDPGIPMLTAAKFTTNLTRASVQKVYDQIKSDLNQALPGLPDKPDFNTNPSKVAAYAIMARVCLNTREFTEAEHFADLTLAIQNTLLDLNNYKVNPATTFPLKLKNPEEIFLKRTAQYPSSFPVSTDAMNMYDQVNDLRYTTIYLASPVLIPGSNFTTGKGYYKNRLTNDGVYVGPSVPEIMLIKAECEARAEHPAVATGILNVLRRNRYEKSNYNADLTASSGKEALHMVIDERKREFIARGFRWFDQRRLSKDPGFINTVNRVFKGTSYTLEPGSNRYTYAIADKYIQLNPEITQNPR